MVKRLSAEREKISLCEVLDRVLNTGVVVVGEVVISVADVDLIYLGLQITLTSVETANRVGLALDMQGHTAPARPEPKQEPAWT